jgi:hypothetical protein
MIASVHVADIGARNAFAAWRGASKPTTTRGLRHAEFAFAAPLRGSRLPVPQLGRGALISFWDDDAAADAFDASHPLARLFAPGWRVRLEPLRAFGSWPGLPDSLPSARTTEYDGPAVVVTLGRLRLTQAPRFLRASGWAERAAQQAPDLIWATALARPPLVATCSLWQSTRALSTYAYGRREPAHTNAIEAGEAKAFHHQSAFIRFRPYAATGSLDGKNPLGAGALPV